MKVVTCYWHGPSRYTYVDDDVIRLHEQLERHVTDLEFVVYVDDDYDIPGRLEYLEHPASYMSEVEMYREPGPIMAIGLDTVIRGNIDDLPFDKMRASRSPHEKLPNTGVVLCPDTTGIYENYHWRRDEMRYIANHVEDVLPPSVAASYKWDNWRYWDPPIVYFHGAPKPRDVKWLSVTLN